MATFFERSLLLFAYIFTHFVGLNLTKAQPTYDQYKCSVATYTNNSLYGQNLNTAISSIVSNTNRRFGSPITSSGFYNTSSGQFPDLVYTIALCRGDVETALCISCINELASRLTQSYCPSRKVGIAWFEKCMFRYSDNETINHSLDLVPLFTMRNMYSSNFTEFNQAVQRLGTLIDKLKAEAARGKDRKTSQTVIIVLVPTVISLILFSSGFIFLLKRKKQRKAMQKFQGEDIPPETEAWSSIHFAGGSMHQREEDDAGEMNYYNLTTIQAATNNFSPDNKLGEGGFGPVYWGKLDDGKEIAVKRLSTNSGQGLEEFKTEVRLIIKLQHKNLVRLLGCCIKGHERILVYEYMANTSVDAFLFNPIKCKELDWAKRANIVSGIAKGLRYLHEDSRLKIIHRDMKASNVLLDDGMNPKISDFGTARIFGVNQIEANTCKIVGTYGYMAPEYAMEGLFSIKSDVYSFGVLLLEIICGKRNSGFCHQEHTENLLSYAWRLWKEGKGEQLIDQNLIDSCLVSEALRWINIALLCVQEDPNARPTMSSVVFMLEGQSASLPEPSEPPSSFGRLFISDESTATGASTGVSLSNQKLTSASNLLR